CGGAKADIVVLPTASRLADTGARYERIFSNLGAGQVATVDFDTRAQCEDAASLARIARATGVFFTGGNQLSLSTILGGTPVAKLIRSRNAEGVHVAGTSAGASFISEHMIAFGEDGASPVAGSVRLAPGLGLTNRVIIDQHFRQRDRIGRLLTALAYNPFAVGIGLDEDTAAFISPENVLEVEGSGGITLIDASGIEFSSMDLVDEGQPVCMLGVGLHLLVAGTRFDLSTRQASPGKLARPRN
ncbi:MAG: cyanophycinase, partial [Arenimonas sp.]